MDRKTKDVDGLSRRNFLGAAGVVAAGVALAGCSSSDETTTESGAETVSESTTESMTEASMTTSNEAITTELPIKEMPAPDVTHYDCDILVVGGGWAGMAAAVEAGEKNMSCVVVDKGRPGFSGYSPWSNSWQFFDESYGDDRENFVKVMTQGGEYMVNQNWYGKWLDESRTTYDIVSSWGVLDQYPVASDADKNYFETSDWTGYNRYQGESNRHHKFVGIIEDSGAELVQQTMITDVLEEDGKIVGAVGLHVFSGTTITFTCKAVIMATGAGSYKPAGYPTGTSTLDGTGIAYRHGLAISGEEFNDFHGTSGDTPGSCWHWIAEWTEPDFITRETDDITEETEWPTIMLGSVNAIAAGGSANMAAISKTETAPAPEAEEDTEAAEVILPGSCPDRTTVDGDPRVGTVADAGKAEAMAGSDLAGAPVAGSAIGMGVHKGQGIWPGVEKTDGSTDLAGFYAAGDSMASYAIGASYFGVGYSSSMSAVQGRVVCDAAADYAASVDAPSVSDDTFAAAAEAVQAPMNRANGYDPNWARELLQSTMSPYWVTVWKTEDSLNLALKNVEFLRDTVIPNLAANNPHELKLCHEMTNKIVCAEAKCRASLARKESRGLHYRADYPFRDDENFLAYITCQMGADGEMETAKVEEPTEWAGDLTEDYEIRYLNRFPGEAEALGLTV